MSFRERQPSLRHDRRGSVHMMEVMIVGIMVMGAVMAASAIQSGMERTGQTGVQGHEDRAEDVLDALRGLPATDTTVHFTHRLEERIVHNLTDDDDALARIVRAHYAAENRLVLQMGAKEVHVMGPDEVPAGAVPDGASALWYSRLGQTLVRPMVSHQDEGMDVWFQMLPVWVDAVARPAGSAMDVQVDLDGAQDWNLSQGSFHRLPLSGQHPLVLEPVDPGGTSAWVVSESDVQNGTEYEWDLSVRITPTEPDRVWLAQGDVFELIPASHAWTLAGQEEEWRDVSTADDPVARLEYQGPPRRGSGEAWFNVSLHRSGSDPVTGIELLRLRTQSHLGAEVNVALTPDEVVRPGPVGVVVSQPTPLPTGDPLPIVFTLTNPSDESLHLDRLQVGFDAGHQFEHEPSDWSRTSSGERVFYDYTGPSVTVPAGGASVVELPVKVADALEGDNVRRDLPPVLEYLGEGLLEPPTRDDYLSASGDPVPRSVAVPHGDRLHLAALAGDDKENGTHTVRVRHSAADLVPPGVATYKRLNESSGGFFPDLLETRFAMQLDHETSLRPEKTLDVKLDLGDLRTLLDSYDAELSGDPVRFEVRAGDLLETVTGRPEAVHTQSHAKVDLQDGMELVAELEFARSASLGPVVVDTQVVVPTTQHGEVALHFLSYAMRTENGEQVVPVFMNAHLQYWLAGVGESSV